MFGGVPLANISWGDVFALHYSFGDVIALHYSFGDVLWRQFPHFLFLNTKVSHNVEKLAL